jgi:hypothetical protein
LRTIHFEKSSRRAKPNVNNRVMPHFVT